MDFLYLDSAWWLPYVFTGILALIAVYLNAKANRCERARKRFEQEMSASGKRSRGRLADCLLRLAELQLDGVHVVVRNFCFHWPLAAPARITPVFAQHEAIDLRLTFVGTCEIDRQLKGSDVASSGTRGKQLLFVTEDSSYIIVPAGYSIDGVELRSGDSLEDFLSSQCLEVLERFRCFVMVRFEVSPPEQPDETEMCEGQLWYYIVPNGRKLLDDFLDKRKPRIRFDADRGNW